MNLAIRRIGANIAEGDSFHADASAPATQSNDRPWVEGDGRCRMDGLPARPSTEESGSPPSPAGFIAPGYR